MSDILKISQFINPTLGFFSHMTFDFEFMTTAQLDILFYANYGEKNPAPIVLKTTSLVPTVLEVTALALMCQSLYITKWTRLKSLCKSQYDPIHNYEDKLTETITEVGTGGNTTGGTFTDTGTDTLSKDATRTDNLKSSSQLASDVTTAANNTDTLSKDDTRTDNLTSGNHLVSDVTKASNNTDSVYGFNSSDASNADKSVTSGTENVISTDTITNTGTQKNVSTDTDVLVASGTEHEIGSNVIDNTGTQKNISTDTDTVDKTKTSAITVSTHSGNDRTRESTHSGNIGNLTTQQLMKQEIELWKWNFIQNVLADLCEFTTLPIYLS